MRAFRERKHDREGGPAGGGCGCGDLAAVRLDDLETQPIYHVISQLIYVAGRHQVSDVWIAGRRKLAARGLVDIDTAEVVAKARHWRERIATS